MSGGITVKEFKHIPGVNDAEYIKKLEELREIDKGIISAAVAKVKRLSAQLKEQPEIIRCKDCKRWDDSMDMFEVAPYCHRLEIDTRANDFCAWAEKRGEAE